MSHRRRGALAGAVAAALLASLTPAAGAVTVSVRVAGDAVGVERTVDTSDAPVGSCPGHSAGGAIEKAVDGSWDRMAFVSQILGETHSYGPTRDYWNFWIDGTYSQKGICDYIVKPGDRVLMLVQRDSALSKPTVFPLELAGTPSAVNQGERLTVTVTEQRTDGATTTPVPAAGASVAGGGAVAQTDADGHATLVLTSVGSVQLRASRSGNVGSDATTVNVLAPPAAAPAAAAPAAPIVTAIRDVSAPRATIRGIFDGRRFARGKGPRRIRAVVDGDASGLLAVKLRLTRTDRGRCTYFSGKFERFKHARCGAANGLWFRVGDQPQIDYLLPSALPRGRYVLDVNAIDKAFNRDDTRRRGANRVVFHVR